MYSVSNSGSPHERIFARAKFKSSVIPGDLKRVAVSVCAEVIHFLDQIQRDRPYIVTSLTSELKSGCV